MPRPRKDTVLWSPGSYYHIYNRGVSKAALFREQDDFSYVLKKMNFYCRKFDLSLIAYCLMWNHYHFLTRQNGDHPAGLLPQSIFNGYTKAYCKWYGYSGTLFERRYQAKRVETGAHLLHLCRYIHANPVKAGYVDEPGSWPYSNYLDWVFERDGGLIDREFIRDNFGDAYAYKLFVKEYLDSDSHSPQ